jgi:hypothetical protein
MQTPTLIDVAEAVFDKPESLSTALDLIINEDSELVALMEAADVDQLDEDRRQEAADAHADALALASEPYDFN